jgi:broad specificity phosphatase PhoE
MLRAEQTAQFVNKYQHKKIIIVPDIEECNKVVFTGCNKIIFGTSPDNMEKYERELARARRSIRFFKAILRKYEGKHILLVGHGNSFRAIIGSVLGFSIADSPFISLEPCSLSTLVFKKQRLLGIPHLNLCVQNSQPLPFNDKLPRMRLAALGGKLSR